ncbi:LPS export ABC transporter periplasmic protein LptC [Candidatus Pelagibacter sp.]|uniref:LPS export ABC transporter periplasmic protein LptC n=1 Tax=Candidatus Pelagibacter sp. TaxID=2024849 RepID=UPI003F862757
MKIKIFLGVSLIFFFFALLIFFYFKSDSDKKLIEKKKKIEITEKKNIEITEERIESSNIIEDVSYSAKDTNGNEYFLKASEGTIDQNDSNYIFLKSVNALINLKNYNLVEISSDFGKYNINNYDTIFSKNVIITYLDNKITGDYLDFSWEKNLMIISRDVILKNNKSSLQADVIEVNIETRDIKIFMYEENKKVNIKSLN